MEFYGLPPIEKKRPARPRGLPGAQMGHIFISHGSATAAPVIAS
jgi:hypothetical protein